MSLILFRFKFIYKVKVITNLLYYIKYSTQIPFLFCISQIQINLYLSLLFKQKRNIVSSQNNVLV